MQPDDVRSLKDAAARVKAMPRMTYCSCGRVYALADLPEACECGVQHFGRWARANHAAMKAAKDARSS